SESWRARSSLQSVLQEAGVLHARRLARFSGERGKGLDTPVEPGALLAAAALRGALDGDRGVRAPSAVDAISQVFSSPSLPRIFTSPEPPGHAEATMATAFAGHKSPAVAMRLVPPAAGALERLEAREQKAPLRRRARAGRTPGRTGQGA
ncbi:MAG TPA: hypothetical protein VMK12_22695, partial [Anaeromyxobacteraceae bacterium]|nr:hypothetical protein [Anaeromyxobacteraceae bacterium]